MRRVTVDHGSLSVACHRVARALDDDARVSLLRALSSRHSLRDIARATGLTAAMLSFVLNGKRRMTENVAYRLLLYTFTEGDRQDREAVLGIVERSLASLNASLELLKSLTWSTGTTIVRGGGR